MDIVDINIDIVTARGYGFTDCPDFKLEPLDLWLCVLFYRRTLATSADMGSQTANVGYMPRVRKGISVRQRLASSQMSEVLDEF
jgi:hypothetical protein